MLKLRHFHVAVGYEEGITSVKGESLSEEAIGNRLGKKLMNLPGHRRILIQVSMSPVNGPENLGPGTNSPRKFDSGGVIFP